MQWELETHLPTPPRHCFLVLLCHSVGFVLAGQEEVKGSRSGPPVDRGAQASGLRDCRVGNGVHTGVWDQGICSDSDVPPPSSRSGHWTAEWKRILRTLYKEILGRTEQSSLTSKARSRWYFL